MLRIDWYFLHLNYNRNDPRPKPSLREVSKFLPGDIVHFGFEDILNIAELRLYMNSCTFILLGFTNVIRI